MNILGVSPRRAVNGCHKPREFSALTWIALSLEAATIFIAFVIFWIFFTLFIRFLTVYKKMKALSTVYIRKIETICNIQPWKSITVDNCYNLGGKKSLILSSPTLFQQLRVGSHRRICYQYKQKVKWHGHTLTCMVNNVFLLKYHVWFEALLKAPFMHQIMILRVSFNVVFLRVLHKSWYVCIYDYNKLYHCVLHAHDWERERQRYKSK